MSERKQELEVVAWITVQSLGLLRANVAVRYSDIVPTRQRDHIVPLTDHAQATRLLAEKDAELVQARDFWSERHAEQRDEIERLSVTQDKCGSIVKLLEDLKEDHGLECVPDNEWQERARSILSITQTTGPLSIAEKDAEIKRLTRERDEAKAEVARYWTSADIKPWVDIAESKGLGHFGAKLKGMFNRAMRAEDEARREYARAEDLEDALSRLRAEGS